jgi:hypothetical protein
MKCPPQAFFTLLGRLEAAYTVMSRRMLAAGLCAKNLAGQAG